MEYIFWGWDNRIIVPWPVSVGERNEDVILQEIKHSVCVDTKGLASQWAGVIAEVVVGWDTQLGGYVKLK